MPFGGQSTGDIASDYTRMNFGLKGDINDKLSYAVIYDQPWGVDVSYGYPNASTATIDSPLGPIPNPVALLSGTYAKVDSDTLTGMLRYKFTPNWSVHGGLRAQKVSGSVGLKGLAYGQLNGYEASFDDDLGVGYVLGGAYERPEIALRVALTYSSAIDHELDTVETTPLGQISSVTKVETPESWNLDFQTGLNEKTLLFGGVRWVEHSALRLNPQFFTGAGGGTLTDLDDSTTWTIGLGRKITDQFSIAATYDYEAAGDSDLVSPLAPTNGSKALTLAGIYTKDNMKITTGIKYVKVGDAWAETGGEGRAHFEGTKAIGVGIQVGYHF